MFKSASKALRRCQSLAATASLCAAVMPSDGGNHRSPVAAVWTLDRATRCITLEQRADSQVQSISAERLAPLLCGVGGCPNPTVSFDGSWLMVHGRRGPECRIQYAVEFVCTSLGGYSLSGVALDGSQWRGISENRARRIAFAAGTGKDVPVEGADAEGWARYNRLLVYGYEGSADYTWIAVIDLRGPRVIWSSDDAPSEQGVTMAADRTDRCPAPIAYAGPGKSFTVAALSGPGCNRVVSVRMSPSNKGGFAPDQ